MATKLFTKCVLIAAVSAVTISFSPVASMAAAKKKAVKNPGSEVSGTDVGNGCTAHCNAFKWCHIHWRIKGGSIPSLFFCREGNCPPNC